MENNEKIDLLADYQSRVIVSNLKTPIKVLRNLIELRTLLRFLGILALFVMVSGYLVHEALLGLYMCYAVITSAILCNRNSKTGRFIYKTLFLMFTRDRNTYFSEDIQYRRVVSYVKDENQN